ncbi:glycerol-3-phosphate 1-O-acyltransferase PlsY [Cohnella sp. CFH 77786]|uniref:glycerol-3-phosphate 1-O-acyltransferase PlsY n=1 Tax=Cohnella sp. CFH 77786 TaxID=2662265 RepID=UPI001C6101AB|nr:glycerol-3-phosphate 1-O-acyltransferase PlsY [Cohnella sp. CFH 77786]MBW5446657.1 glycerol-3-phosphate 1-O-acyltransferase PlsY [Cohnella sp. CFH 77786]
MFTPIVAIAAGYLLGSVSFSILMARWLKKIDIRQHGSGNAGATNTLRVLGKGPALAVFLLDVAKGIAAVLIGHWLGKGEDWVPVLCGLAAIVGHNWPVYFRFKGGKGIATTIGALAVMAFLPTLLAGLAAIATIASTRYVSLGSLVFAVLSPVLIALFGYEAPYIWGAVIVAVMAVLRHRKNIVKLVKGTENKLGGNKKGEPHGA